MTSPVVQKWSRDRLQTALALHEWGHNIDAVAMLEKISNVIIKEPLGHGQKNDEAPDTSEESTPYGVSGRAHYTDGYGNPIERSEPTRWREESHTEERYSS